MDAINKQVANLLREQILQMRSDKLVKLESERILETRLEVGRQRIRAVIQVLMSEGLLVKQEGKGTYITPVVRNKYLNLICSPDIKSNDPFYNNLLVELTNFAAKESVNIIPLSMSTLENGFMNSPTLLVGRMNDSDILTLINVFKTIIAFENYVEQDDLNQIYFDHYNIGWNAVKALSEYGHSRIVHLTGPNRYASSNLRRNGFVDAARKYNVTHTILGGKMNFQGGYKAGATIMEHIKDGGFTAAFVANDWMAVGLIQFLKENGVRVPDDVSILGVDNISLSSQISPALSTFSLDMRMMVAEVFVLLNTMQTQHGVIDDTPIKGRRVILTPVLISRDSIMQIGKR